MLGFIAALRDIDQEVHVRGGVGAQWVTGPLCRSSPSQRALACAP